MIMQHSPSLLHKRVQTGVRILRLTWAPRAGRLSTSEVARSMKRAQEETGPGGSDKRARQEESAVEERPVVFRFPKTRTGKFLKRYKRFLADVRLDDGESSEVVVAHCPNTGPMIGLLDIPEAISVLSCSDNPKRKCKFTFELVKVEGERVMVGVHSANANNIVRSLLEKRLLPSFGAYTDIKREVVYGKDKKSRCDFLLIGPGDKKTYVEVKSVTLAEEMEGSTDGKKIGIFPDTVSTRAQKHVQELMDVVEKKQAEAACVFLVQRRDCSMFAPAFEKDPKYSELVVKAAAKGVKMIALAVDFVEAEGGWDVVYLGELGVDIKYKQTN